jgi:Zn-dependent peptidase ImmA (M78 family)
LTSNVSGLNRLSTLIHEIAHSLLHFKDSSVFFGDEYTSKLTREQAELQAEAVAYTVLRNYDLPVKHSATYLALWRADKDTVIKNQTIISKVSNFIIDGIDQIAEEKQKEQPMNETQKEKIGNIIRDMANESKTRERVEQKYGNFEAIKKLMDEKWEEKKKRRNYGF